MAKLALAPADILALLKNNPELEVELNNKALSQVADVVIRKVTQSAVRERVGHYMEKMLSEQTGWNKRTLAPALQKMIESSIAEASRDAWNTKLSTEIKLAISVEANNQMRETAQKLADAMKSEIRNIVREELRAILGKV